MRAGTWSRRPHQRQMSPRSTPESGRSAWLLIVAVTLPLIACVRDSPPQQGGTLSIAGLEEVWTRLPKRGDVPEYSFGGLRVENVSSAPVTLTGLEPGHLDAWLRWLGAVAFREGENESYFSTACGPFPPKAWKSHSLGRLILEPGAVVHLGVGLRLTQHKPGRLSNLVLHYSVNEAPQTQTIEYIAEFRRPERGRCRPIPAGEEIRRT